MALKHLTARDMVSRWDMIEAHPRATATMAAQFLDSMRLRFPFPISPSRPMAVPSSGPTSGLCAGSSASSCSCCRRAPRSSTVTWRAQRTHTEEFYEAYDRELELVPLNQALLEWKQVYDYLRPHQSLDGRTPAAYIDQCYPNSVSSALSRMY